MNTNTNDSSPASGAPASLPAASSQWHGRQLVNDAIRPVVALLTDFGQADPYVAQMKGAILRRAPHVRLVDITHEISPFHLEQAGFFLQVSHSHFPRGTVFVAVVDPGVGTGRRIICLARDGRLFLAPDNGLLTPLLDEPGQAELYDLTPSPETLSSASRTFHARDIFAPLAARLAEGNFSKGIGKKLRLDDAVRLPALEPELQGETLAVRVLHVDRFGNCILNVPVDPWHARLAGQGTLVLRLPDASEHPLILATTYAELADGSTPGLLQGSQGYVELALGKASAARAFGLHPGSAVWLHPAGTAA